MQNQNAKNGSAGKTAFFIENKKRMDDTRMMIDD
jgi:hypothetical protein